MLRTNALTADRQSCQGKDGYVRRFTTQLSMAVIQATAATTPSPSPGMKEAVGKSTKWKGKLAEPSRVVKKLVAQQKEPPNLLEALIFCDGYWRYAKYAN